MAVVSTAHLAFAFGILGNIVSFLVYLAPLPTFYRIYKKKSTEGFQSIPYAVALFSAMLYLYYAFLKTKDGIMLMTINSVGCAIEFSYLILFMLYAPKQAKLRDLYKVRNLNIRKSICWKRQLHTLNEISLIFYIYTGKLILLFNMLTYGFIIASTMLFSAGHLRVAVVGWICAVFSVTVFAAPLSIMRQVMRTKSVEFMPFSLSFFLTICAVIWFFYGLLIKDYYIATPNILGFTFGIAQMMLYAIYKDRKKQVQPEGNLQDITVILDLSSFVEMQTQPNKPQEIIAIDKEEEDPDKKTIEA